MTPFTSNHSKNEKARTCLLMRSHHCSRSRKSEAKRPLCSPSLKKKMRYNRFYKAAFEPRAQKTGRPSPRESNPGINFPLRGTPQVLAKLSASNRGAEPDLRGSPSLKDGFSFDATGLDSFV